MKDLRKLLVVSALLLLSPAFAFADEHEDCDGTRLKTNLVSSVGITGSATICISGGGLRGRLEAGNLIVGHAYTVWFFYTENGLTGGPGRFDSNVAEDEEVLFRGHVGGLKVASGGVVKLALFHHPDITAIKPLCDPMPPTNAARADNLLNFACAGPVAVALFTIP